MRDSYDVVIVGGAIMGCATAWWLTELADFAGKILIVEPDPSYASSGTALTNSCIRQQFSHPLNVQLSQFTARFIETLSARMPEVAAPDLTIRDFGYLYLAGSETQAEVLRANHAVQMAAGAGTRLLTPAEIAESYPFYDLEGVLLGSLNTIDEGYFDGGGLFEAFRRSARARGVEFAQAAVTGMTVRDTRVEAVQLSDGRRVACGHVVNAAGTRAAQVAARAGIALPVEPRKRFTWVFEAARPLDRDLPLTIDPSGIHVRTDGVGTYLVGAAPEQDGPADPDDFTMDPAMWEERVWPTLATRIPQFDALRVRSEWAGHYAYNTLDQNALLGALPHVQNLLFQNGFSGHGLQQAAGIGRGVAELITFGGFRTLDLTPFAAARVMEAEVVQETAVI